MEALHICMGQLVKRQLIPWNSKMETRPECRCVDSSRSHRWWRCRRSRGWFQDHRHVSTTGNRMQESQPLQHNHIHPLHRYIFILLDFLHPIETAEAFESVDRLADLPQRTWPQAGRQSSDVILLKLTATILVVAMFVGDRTMASTSLAGAAAVIHSIHRHCCLNGHASQQPGSISSTRFSSSSCSTWTFGTNSTGWSTELSFYVPLDTN